MNLCNLTRTHQHLKALLNYNWHWRKSLPGLRLWANLKFRLERPIFLNFWALVPNAWSSVRMWTSLINSPCISFPSKWRKRCHKKEWCAQRKRSGTLSCQSHRSWPCQTLSSSTGTWHPISQGPPSIWIQAALKCLPWPTRTACKWLRATSIWSCSQMHLYFSAHMSALCSSSIISRTRGKAEALIETGTRAYWSPRLLHYSNIRRRQTKAMLHPFLTLKSKLRSTSRALTSGLLSNVSQAFRIKTFSNSNQMPFPLVRPSKPARSQIRATRSTRGKTMMRTKRRCSGRSS